ncbi:JmjC domain-containing histone demethylation protein 1 [Rhizophlyctis rosea]|uniref:[histone H3]-dimethyl-L-lysine(36) demethylase n=1 Tax=Rhizophlyctis rosea TaxID=64517 RepID=A0AAD5SF14_9FUNG|nr:JmjC domain-containing histone demethylation protein 1 [Rhizophlyctis rosea]
MPAENTLQLYCYCRSPDSPEDKRFMIGQLHEGNTAVEEKRFTKILQSKTFAKDRFEHLVNGEDVTLERFRRTGLKEPILIERMEGLGMEMPEGGLTVSDVADMCGRTRTIDVIEVSTQTERSMTLNEWAKYFDQPPEKRERILNVISLEISDTPLSQKCLRPKVVRDLDWIETVWPSDLKVKEYPRVQLYCLMSVADSYTDFHIDFGGSSVFYHLLSGEKVFYFIEPTKANLKKYEKWSSSPDQGATFLGDEVKECVEVRIGAGTT